jgi:hypothetical protein
MGYIVRKKSNVSKIFVTDKNKKENQNIEVISVDKTNKIVKLIVKFTVDKKYIITNNIDKVEIKFSPNKINKLNEKEQIKDKRKNKNINRKLIKGRNYEKRKIKNRENKLNIKKITEADLTKKINFNNIKKLMKKFSSDSEIFGVKKITRVKKNKTRFDDKRRRNEPRRKINREILKTGIEDFKRGYNKNTNRGIDIANKMAANQMPITSKSKKFLGKESAKDKSIKDKRSDYFYSNVILESAKSDIGANNITGVTIETVEEADRYELIESEITILEADLNKNSGYIIVSGKSRFGYEGLQIQQYKFSVVEAKNKFYFPLFNHSTPRNTQVSAFSRNDKVCLSLSNNDQIERKYKIYYKFFNNDIKKQDQHFNNFVTEIVPANINKIIDINLNYKNNYQFRVNIFYDGVEYFNTKFANYYYPIRKKRSPVIGMSYEIVNKKISISISNLPSDATEIQLLKRNLTKKENYFIPTLIKDKKIKKNAQFLNIDNSNHLSFVLYDSEFLAGNIVEYKVKIKNIDGEYFDSSSSCFVKHVAKKSLTDQRVVGITFERLNTKFSKVRLKLEGNLRYFLQSGQPLLRRSLVGKFTTKTFLPFFHPDNVNDIVRFYVNIEATNLKTSESLFIGKFEITNNDSVNLINFDIPHGLYQIRVIPKIYLSKTDEAIAEGITDNHVELINSVFDLAGDDIVVNLNMIQGKTFSISQGEIEFKHSENNSLKQYVVTFKGINSLITGVDFYNMLFEENGNINSAGISHISSNDELISYVYNVSGMLGKINFYCQPVYNDGNLGRLEFLGGVKLEKYD